MNALQKLFLLRSCSDSYFENRSRPCLLYQIKRCSAPCVGRIGRDDYAELVEDAKAFLAGKSTGKSSRACRGRWPRPPSAGTMRTAAVYRDRLRALTYIQGSQSVHAEWLGDADVFALARKGGTMSIQGFFIRGGQNWGHRAFFPAHTADVRKPTCCRASSSSSSRTCRRPDESWSTASSPTVSCSRRCRSGRGRRVVIEVPRRGDRRKLMDQARRNAEEALDRRLAETTTQGRILRELADTFELADVPKRIEVYDNSHIMGTDATGAMIVAGPEGFRKNSYRKFNIKRPETRPGDDFAMMREVLERRFARLEKEDPDRTSGEWPDLLMIDGGKGQLSAVCEVMEDMGVHDVPVVAVSKGRIAMRGARPFICWARAS